jgi:acetylornithine deacetylase
MIPDPRVLERLETLVAFDTQSFTSNLALVAAVERILADAGIDSVRLPNRAGDKAALFATLGGEGDGGVLLSAHTDVVPVAGQAWTSDPFRLRVADGRAYGRGAVDMKGFIALVLAALPAIRSARLARPIHLLLSYDEETTCLGPLDAIAAMGIRLPRPDIVIVGEPTGLEVADAHKSVFTFTTTVHGHEAHSSKPHLGAHAILGAAELILELERQGDALRDAGDPTGRFDPPFATVHVGQIEGGTARNIVPKRCVFDWEVRGVPGMDEMAVPAALERFAEAIVLPRLRAHGWPAAVETVSEVQVPRLEPDPGSAAETLALRLAGRNRTITVPYGTEAGHFRHAGIPTVVCGPGSIDQAHQPDEYIELAELARGERFIRDLVASLSA